LPAVDVLFPVAAFLFELFGPGYLVHDVASFRLATSCHGLLIL
jgi:hypothetical protein